tara:strand:+ start:255 stop:593 length:339 start_codon:yes stop_codon:yes gene_type:complete
MIKLKELLTEGKLKPSFIKKAQVILKKEWGDIVFEKSYDGGYFYIKGSSTKAGMLVDYQDHPLYGDTYEMYPVNKGWPAWKSSSDIKQSENEKDALKDLSYLAKKYKKLLQK